MDNFYEKCDNNPKTQPKLDMDLIKYHIQTQAEKEKEKDLTSEQRGQKLIEICSNLPNIW
jgi:hypothetical protein